MKSARWQAAQSLAVPAKRLFTWHCEHCVEACAPVRAKRVCAWSNRAPFHCAVVWQAVQFCEKLAELWLGFVVP